MTESVKQELLKNANEVTGPYIKCMLKESHNETIDSLIRVFKAYPGDAIEKPLIVEVLEQFRYKE